MKVVSTPHEEEAMTPSLTDTPQWSTERGPGKVTEHSLVVGGVLCRWWGEEEPEGAKWLASIKADRRRLEALPAAARFIAMSIHEEGCPANHHEAEAWHGLAPEEVDLFDPRCDCGLTDTLTQLPEAFQAEVKVALAEARAALAAARREEKP